MVVMVMSHRVRSSSLHSLTKWSFHTYLVLSPCGPRIRIHVGHVRLMRCGSREPHSLKGLGDEFLSLAEIYAPDEALITFL